MRAHRRSIDRRRGLLWLVLGLSWIAFVAPSNAQGTATIRVTGSVEHSLSLGVDDLRRLPATRIEDTRGERGVEPRRYTGVLLRDVLDRAKLVERQPRELRKSIVVATASDNYRVVFSWAELYLSPIGSGVFVVYERDGAPLAPGEGPIALVSLQDTSPGPRHVKWLQTIDVRAVND